MKRTKLALIIFFLFFLFLISNVNATKTYLNENSTWQQNLTNVSLSALSWGDIDNDGDLDLALTGRGNVVGSKFSKIYINNGTTLQENSTWQNNLTSVSYGSLALGDVDNDGDLDLALSGCEGQASYVGGCPSTSTTLIYINNGTTLQENITWQNNLTGVYRPGSLTFVDIDNDGDLDLGLTGEDSGALRISKIYINNGTNLVESNQWQTNLTGMRESTLAFGDYDNDGDLDLILSGIDSSQNDKTIAYVNNGSSFIENPQWQNNLVDVSDSSITFADFDNDSDLDLSVAGCCDIHRIYRNNGTAFIEINREITGGLDGMFAGSVAFGDYDNDGDLDLITSGREDGTFLFLYNQSINNFTGYWQDPESHIFNVYYSSVAWLDLDNDTDLDLIETGYGSTESRVFVYTSNRSLTKANTQPTAPIGFNSSSLSGQVTLNWSQGSDSETNANGLYYNLRVGTSSGGNQIVSGVYGGSSNPTAGYFGNMMQRRRINLSGLWLQPGTTYYWNVQTIDTALKTSSWSDEQSFTTGSDVTNPVITLNKPDNGNYSGVREIVFNASAYDDTDLANVSLYGNWTSSWVRNETNSSGINNTNYIFTKNMSGEGVYYWKIHSCDNSSNCIYSSIRSFSVDLNYPQVSLISPSSGYSWTSSSTVTFYYNVSDLAIANCSLIINGSVYQSDTSISVNTTQPFTQSMSNGAYSWQVNCTDNLARENNSETRTLSVSYTAPGNGGGGGGGGGITPSVCGNGICESGENYINCPEDCEKPEACVENWTCTEWSECIDGYHSRNCTDLNDCGTKTYRPKLTARCDIGEEGEVEGEIEEELKFGWKIMIISGIVIIIAVVIVLILKGKRNWR